MSVRKLRKRKQNCVFPLDQLEEAKALADERRITRKGHQVVLISSSVYHSTTYYLVASTAQVKGREIVYCTNPGWEKTGKLTSKMDNETRTMILDLIGKGLPDHQIARQTRVNASSVNYLRKLLEV